MTNYLSCAERAETRNIGPLQTKIFEIIKQEKEIKIVDIGKRLGYHPKHMTNIHFSMYGLQTRDLVQVRGTRNKVAIFLKDYEGPKPPRTKEKQPRKIIKIQELQNIITEEIKHCDKVLKDKKIKNDAFLYFRARRQVFQDLNGMLLK